MSDSSQPYLVELDANTREPASTINLSVAGTVGPDYLGQETVDVDGHPNDRPGVKYRLPENDENDPRIRQMDTGEELPVLLSSDMGADPIEGTQGSYTEIIEGECNRCGYDRLRHTVVTLAGEHKEVCNACGATQTHRSENGYRMPTTSKQRMDRSRDRLDQISDAPTAAGLYDANGSTDACKLITDTQSIMIDRRELIKMVFDLADFEDKTLFELLDPEMGVVQRADLYLDALTNYRDNEEENDG